MGRAGGRRQGGNRGRRQRGNGLPRQAGERRGIVGFRVEFLLVVRGGGRQRQVKRGGRRGLGRSMRGRRRRTREPARPGHGALRFRAASHDHLGHILAVRGERHRVAHAPALEQPLERDLHRLGLDLGRDDGPLQRIIEDERHPGGGPDLLENVGQPGVGAADRKETAGIGDVDIPARPGSRRGSGEEAGQATDERRPRLHA